MVTTHMQMQKIKVKRQVVQNLEYKQADGHGRFYYLPH